MTRIRGLNYLMYIGKTVCPCGLKGYKEIWHSYLGSDVFSVKHIKGNKTIKRCWLRNGNT